jgi:hypothetical protein
MATEGRGPTRVELGQAKYFGAASDETTGDEMGQDGAGGDGQADAPGAHATYAVRPRVAFGWRAGFPADMTRWRFTMDKTSDLT